MADNQPQVRVASHFQDRHLASNSVPLTFMRAVCAPGRGLWSPAAMVYINWMHPAVMSAELNWSAELRVPRTHCMEQSAICHVRQWLVTGCVSQAVENVFIRSWRRSICELN